MSNSKKEPITFTAACSIRSDYVYLAGKPDKLDDEQDFSRMFFYDAQNSTTPWVHHDLQDWNVVSVCSLGAHNASPRQYCALSREGEVELCWVGGSRVERIEGAGITRDELPIYGYVNAIRSIGSDLYVAGSGGQVYRRNNGEWADIAYSLRRAAVSPLEERLIVQQELGSRELNDIDGSAFDDLYAGGSGGEIYHFDGTDWQKCVTESRKILTCVRAVTPDEVWACGFGGTLLRGSHSAGFKSVGKCSEALIFTSVALLNGAVFLASDKGVFTLSSDGVIRRVKTGLVHEVDDSTILDVREGVLWSFGYKDIVSFDGDRWARLEHPDNEWRDAQ